MKENVNKKTSKAEKESSIDDRLDQIIEHKKSENSALRKIYNSLNKVNPKGKSKNQ